MALAARVAHMVPEAWIARVTRLSWRYPLLRHALRGLADQLRGVDGTIQRGVGAGLRINIGDSEAGFLLGVSKPDLQVVFKELLADGMTLYDIGANVGFFSMIGARLVGNSGRIIAFEPLERNAKYIEHNSALNRFSNIRVMRVALGRENAQARFQLSERPTWGHLAGVGAPPVSHIGDTAVALRTLDYMVEHHGLPLPDVMKIDVEGSEIDVLAGAERTISRAAPILLIELHGTNLAIARTLACLDYRIAVLGGAATVDEAHWNCHVIGVPAFRAHLLAAFTAGPWPAALDESSPAPSANHDQNIAPSMAARVGRDSGQ